MSIRTEFQLESGRSMRISALDQWCTYGGLLEGLPTKEMNGRIIQRTIDHAQRRFHFTPYVLQPPETPIEVDRPYRFGTPASIPEIVCVANCYCMDTVNDKTQDGSTLPLIWFQTEFAWPIEESILLQIRALDWDKYATDFCY